MGQSVSNDSRWGLSNLEMEITMIKKTLIAAAAFFSVATFAAMPAEAHPHFGIGFGFGGFGPGIYDSYGPDYYDGYGRDYYDGYGPGYYETDYFYRHHRRHHPHFRHLRRHHWSY